LVATLFWHGRIEMEWIEVKRKLLGFNIRKGENSRDKGGIYAVFSIAEHCEETGEYRNAIRNGPTVRYHDHGWDAFVALAGPYIALAENPGMLADERPVVAPSPHSFWKKRPGRRPKAMIGTDQAEEGTESEEGQYRFSSSGIDLGLPRLP